MRSKVCNKTWLNNLSLVRIARTPAPEEDEEDEQHVSTKNEEEGNSALPAAAAVFDAVPLAPSVDILLLLLA